jgi:hypothetical protein
MNRLMGRIIAFTNSFKRRQQYNAVVDIMNSVMDKLDKAGLFQRFIA